MLNKLYECKKCGRKSTILSKGLCGFCRSKELPPKKRSSIKQKIKVKPKEENYSDFYAKCLEELSEYRISEYSGRPICYPSTCNVCHILPKRKYKSVAKDRRNIIFLTQEEHTRFDYLLDTANLEKLKEEYYHLYLLVLNRVKTMLEDGSILENGKMLDKIIEELDGQGK